jgi:hypothetical protein
MTAMSDTGSELNEMATSLEHIALALPRNLAAICLIVAAARIVGETPEPERAASKAQCENGWQNTLAEYAAISS